MSIEQRSCLLNELFKTHSDQTYRNITTVTESKNIDIFIKTEDNRGYSDCWIIENKIKSSQHSDQLERYEEYCKKKYKGSELHYLFLTLIDEKPLGDSHVWISATYGNLVNLLGKYMDDMKDCPDATILKEYYFSINKLSAIAEEFIKKPQNFPDVFTDGNLSKEEKQQNKDYEKGGPQYISDYGLETILQKMYCNKIKNKIAEELKPNIGDIIVSDTRGDAVITFKFNKKRNDGMEFDTSFQLGTFKFAITKDYDNPNQDNIKEVSLWKKEFEKLRKKYSESGYKRINLPKKNKKARISISKIYKDWYKFSEEKILETIQIEINLTHEMMNYVCTIHDKKRQ